jgi:hypothetical protein
MRLPVKSRLAPLALALVVLGGQSAAQPTGDGQPIPLDDAEALAMDAKMYAAEFGVPYDEALRRMTIMVYGRDATADAALAEGADFAGRYFDNKAADFGLIVATKKAGRADRTLSFTPAIRENYGRLNAAQRQERNAARKAARLAARLSDAEVRRAEDTLNAPVSLKVKYKGGQAHSLAELGEAMQRLSAIGNEIPGLTALTVDEAGNSVRVFTTPARSTSCRAASCRLPTCVAGAGSIPHPATPTAVRAPA